MGTTLSGKTPATTFDALIKVGDNSALTGTLKTISDGLGNDSPLKLSTDAVGVGSITNIETEIGGKQATLISGTNIKTINSSSLLGSGDVAVQATLISGTNIKTINSSSLLGSGDVAVQETLVSGTNIKTINSSSLLGSGDVAVQETLVSGTNIKTINGSSLLGSGDISVSASPAGSDTQIQFNDSGAFGADSLFNWDNTNKRLGVGETTPTAAVHIKGEGNNSASYAFKVQNSQGTTLFDIRNDSVIRICPNSTNAVSFRNAKLQDGNAVFGTTTIPSSTRLTIKGQGSTSATTAFFVENSSGTDLLKVIDDGQVLVNVQSAEASAKLQIDSTTQGFLPPRMTTTQRDAMEPTAGLIIYNTTNNNLNYYNGTSWTSF